MKIPKSAASQHLPVFLFIDPEGTILSTASTTSDFSTPGKKAESGESFFSLIDSVPANKPLVPELKQLIKNGVSFVLTVVMQYKNGSATPCRLSGEPIRNQEGELLGFVIEHSPGGEHLNPANLNDNSPKMDVLNSTDAFDIFRNLPLGLLLINHEQRVVFVNHELVRLFNIVFPEDQLVGMHADDLYEFLCDKLKNADLSFFKLKNEESYRVNQIGVIQELKNGSLLICDQFPVYINNRYNGRLWWFEKLSNDLQNAEIVSDLQRLMRITNEAAQTGSWEYDLETDQLFLSPTVTSILEIEENFIPSLASVINFSKPGYNRSTLFNAAQKCISAFIAFDTEAEFVSEKGKKIWARITGKPEIIDGQVRKIYGSFQNITDKKKLLYDLEVSSEKYHSLFKENPFIVFQLDAWGFFADMNKKALQVSKLERKHITRYSFRDFVMQEYIHVAEDAFRKAMNGEKLTIRLKLRNLSDQILFVEVTVLPIVVQHEIIGVYGLAKDLTYEEQIQLKLKDSEERFKLAVEGASEGIWDWLIKHNLVYFTSSFKWLINYPETEEYIPGTEALEKLVYPADRESIYLHYINHVKNKVPFEVECRLKSNESEYKWYLLKGQAIWDEKGYAYRMAGSFKDIHAQKILADQLKHSNDRFQRAVNGSNDFIREVYFQTPEKNFISPHLFQELGYKPEEITGTADKFYESILHPDDRLKKDEIRKAHLKNEIPYYKTEFRLRLKDGRYRWYKSKAKATFDAEGNPLVLTGSISDIHIEKQLHESLVETKQLYELAINGSTDTIWDYNFLTQQLTISERASEILGYSIKDLENPEFFNSLIHPDDNVLRNNELDAHLKRQKSYFKATYRIRDKAGQYRWFLSRGQAIFSAHNEPIRITGSLTDIHEQTEMQQQLQVVNQTLQQQQIELEKLISLQTATLNALPEKLIKISPEGSITFIHIPDFNVLFRKQRPRIAENLFELDILPEQIRSFVLNNINTDVTLSDNFEITIEETLFYFNIHLSPSSDGDLLIVIRNITEQKKAEVDLLKSELKYKSLIENMDIGLMEVDNDGIITGAYPYFCKMTGYTADELKGKRAYEILSLEHSDHFEQNLIENRKRGISELYERDVRKKDGEIIRLLISGVPLTDYQGNIIGSVGIHYDITKQKKTERLLDEAKQLGKIGYYEIDLVKNTVTWDKTIRAIYDVTDEFIPTMEKGMSFFKEGDSRERVAMAVKAAILHGTPLIDEFEIISATGKLKHVKIIARVEKVNNKPAVIAGITLDITEVKQYQKQTEEYLIFNQTILSSIKDGFFVLDSSMQFVFANDASCQFFQTPLQSILGKNLCDLFPDRSSYFKKVIQTVQKSGIPQTINLKIPALQKGQWFEFNIYPSRENGVSVLFKDVTIQKEQEETIRALNDKYLAISKATNQIIFEWDLVVGEIVLNDVYYKVTGYAAQEAKSAAFNLSMVHPEDIEKLNSSLMDAVAAKSLLWVADYRFKISDGSYRNMHTQGILQYNDAGTPLSILGTIEDVTDRIQLQEQLVTEKVNAQKQISEAVINAQEQERDFIGHELHDNVNQILSTANLYMQFAEKQAFSNPDTTNKVQKLISKAIDELRFLSKRLSPPDFKETGLSQVIGELVGLIGSASSIHFNYETDSQYYERLPNTKSLVLYRICQELLNNVIKYSKAANCTVYLKENDHGAVVLTVQDDGVGFDPNNVKKGLGLKSTLAKAEVYGGRFLISSSPGNGCTISVEIPYDK